MLLLLVAGRCFVWGSAVTSLIARLQNRARQGSTFDALSRPVALHCWYNTQATLFIRCGSDKMLHVSEIPGSHNAEGKA